jgi:hypothetical protein
MQDKTHRSQKCLQVTQVLRNQTQGLMNFPMTQQKKAHPSAMCMPELDLQ